jgi:2-hydroxy-3-oxopropionate reductase
MKLGVIGLGRMGLPIAGRLLAAGHQLSVLDVVAAPRAQLEAAGARWMATPRDVATASELVLLSLPGPAEVDAVMQGPDGVLAGAARGGIVLQTSTISPKQSRELAAACGARGVDFLDAPVSGGVEGAKFGTLSVIIGGSAAVLKRARPVLAAFTERVFHMGEAGTGSSMKLVIQATYMSQLAAFMEAVGMGREAGLPMKQMLAVLAESSAHHPTIGKRYDKLLADDLSPRVEVRAGLKDMELVREFASDLGLAPAVLSAATEDFAASARAGHARDDLIALTRLQNRKP